MRTMWDEEQARKKAIFNKGLPKKLVGKSFRIYAEPDFLMKKGGYSTLKKERKEWVKYFRFNGIRYRFHVDIPSDAKYLKLRVHCDKIKGKGKHNIASTFKVKEEVARLKDIFPLNPIHQKQLLKGVHNTEPTIEKGSKSYKKKRLVTLSRAEMQRLIKELKEPWYKKLFRFFYVSH